MDDFAELPSDFLLNLDETAAVANSSSGSQHISLFPLQDKNETTTEFTLSGVILLNGKNMTEFWELFVAILVWMTIPYIVMHAVASCLAMIKLRNHAYVLFLVIPLVLMCIIGPCTVGAITSASLAFSLNAGKKFVSPLQCAFLGIIQTVILAFVSFSKLLCSL